MTKQRCLPNHCLHDFVELGGQPADYQMNYKTHIPVVILVPFAILYMYLKL